MGEQGRLGARAPAHCHPQAAPGSRVGARPGALLAPWTVGWEGRPVKDTRPAARAHRWVSRGLPPQTPRDFLGDTGEGAARARSRRLASNRNQSLPPPRRSGVPSILERKAGGRASETQVRIRLNTFPQEDAFSRVVLVMTEEEDFKVNKQGGALIQGRNVVLRFTYLVQVAFFSVAYFPGPLQELLDPFPSCPQGRRLFH